MKSKVFFYGSFMDPKILAKNSLHPTKFTTAYLKDWIIGFAPYATIYPKKNSRVWGITCLLNPSDLDRVYNRPLFDRHRYYPEAVVVSTKKGTQMPALAYISYQPVGLKPDHDYLKILLKIAKQRRFPKEYVALC